MPVQPTTLIKGAAQRFRPLAEEKHVRLDVKLPSDPPSVVDVDERLIARVFHNLLSNAMRLTPRGGAITLGFCAAGPREVEFSVADTGPGIAPGERVRIFEKAQPLPTTTPRAGFGLSLDLCRKIVKLHGGSIWVDSELGKGSQFVLRLPVKQQLKQG